jgi:hypothetical protein
METWWHDAKQDSRRLQGTSAMPPTFRTFLRAEADADYIQTIDRIAIPGLLQTRAYADAILAAGRHLTNTRVDADKREMARAARQQLLLRQDPLRLHALIDEAAIRRVVGGPATMMEQLSQVLTLAKRSNVEVQIVPESAGAYGAMSGPMQILGFDDPAEPATVYVEYEGGGAWFDNKEDVQKYSEMFRSALDLALSAAQSEALIRDRLDE